MSDTGHNEKLIEIHRQSLDILEDQATRFGPNHVPPHILLEINDRIKKIRELGGDVADFTLAKQGKQTILFLSASPLDRVRVLADQEYRDIDAQLQQSSFRDRYELKYMGAVRPLDFAGKLLKDKPTVLHFSGHGEESGQICLEDDQGKNLPVTDEALQTLFGLLKNQVKCVLLNACYAASQAKAISTQIEYVIGMQDKIGSEAARLFAVGFYQALGEDKPIEEAFQLGKIQLMFKLPTESAIPALYHNGEKIQ